MTLDFSRCRLPPFQHQREDTEKVIQHKWLFIASEMRTGKTKIVIDGAQFLYDMNVIDRVIVVAPAPVRDVWSDKTLGELAKHLWLDLPASITEFHARIRTRLHGPQPNGRPRLDWYVTNYEFIRSAHRLQELLPLCDPRTLLVLDESSFVKNWKAAQTEACVQLRAACGRVILLNGTPIFHSPLDLFSQGNILHPSILQCKYITHFKAKYAIQEAILGAGGKPLTDPRGKAIQHITGWVNLDDIQRRFAPITVRRMQADCLDLPPKLDPVAMTAPLDSPTWKAYRDMRDELVIWLKTGDVAVSATAATKVMRLAQITSGFIGGLEDPGVSQQVPLEAGLLESIDLPGSFLDGVELTPSGALALQEQLSAFDQVVPVFQEIGREKLDTLLWFIEQKLEADPNVKIVAWCRFRVELFRTLQEVAQKFPQMTCAAIVGGQKRSERLAALALLKPETAPAGPVFVCGVFGTGSYGLDFTASHISITISHDYSPGRHAQSADRVYGPGQKEPVAYFEIVATGPKGQKTIDHAILEARRAGEDVAAWTAAAWVNALSQE